MLLHWRWRFRTIAVVFTHFGQVGQWWLCQVVLLHFGRRWDITIYRSFWSYQTRCIIEIRNLWSLNRVFGQKLYVVLNFVSSDHVIRGFSVPKRGLLVIDVLMLFHSIFFVSPKGEFFFVCSACIVVCRSSFFMVCAGISRVACAEWSWTVREKVFRMMFLVCTNRSTCYIPSTFRVITCLSCVLLCVPNRASSSPFCIRVVWFLSSNVNPFRILSPFFFRHCWRYSTLVVLVLFFRFSYIFFVVVSTCVALSLFVLASTVSFFVIPTLTKSLLVFLPTIAVSCEIRAKMTIPSGGTPARPFH